MNQEQPTQERLLNLFNAWLSFIPSILGGNDDGAAVGPTPVKVPS